MAESTQEIPGKSLKETIPPDVKEALEGSAKAHDAAKEIFLTLTREAFKAENKRERLGEVFKGVASGLVETSRQPSPGFTEGVGEAFSEYAVEERRRSEEREGQTDRRLDAVLETADAWQAAVNEKFAQAGKKPPKEVCFLPLADIMYEAYIRACRDDDSMAWGLYSGFRELFINLTYPSGSGRIWGSIDSIRDALYHTRAATRLSHWNEMLDTLRLCSSFAPDSLEYTKGVVAFERADLETIDEWPEAKGLYRLFKNLNGKGIEELPEKPQTAIQPPTFLDELAMAVVRQAHQRV